MTHSAIQFLVGTASWTDPSLTDSDLFYPPSVRTAEERLRFYAERFDTVEVDSTYYALPAERNARLWAERTPERFIFNIKAFAMMTQHPAEVSRLPKDLREMLPAGERDQPRVTRPPHEMVDLAFQMFWSAMAPLKEAGKLGMIAFQFPPYFTARPANFDYIASLPERVPGASIAIEFRHPSWVGEPARRAATMEFLRSHGLYYTSIDAPEDKSIVPSFIEATGDQVYLRLHGKNRGNWFKRNITPAERYKYLYSERELQGVADGLKKLDARAVKRAFVIFNNCYQNFGIMNATTMAAILRGRERTA
ncbi:MAG TPA: DUF72 domain-containing protein [Candidatus Binataceae bacterium]|nr:DUF72 domain-containing protein [Candidatus Binataceae bacterium]